MIDYKSETTIDYKGIVLTYETHISALHRTGREAEQLRTVKEVLTRAEVTGTGAVEETRVD